MIVTPSLPEANNGNGQTSQRYADFLSSKFKVRLALEWRADQMESADDDLMIAIHAKKSSTSIAAWAQAKGCSKDCPSLIVVMSGTDLYEDLPHSVEAKKSIELAGQLVTLQDQAFRRLPDTAYGKTRVIYQSAPGRESANKSSTVLHAVMVGHMRPVKDPVTFLRAARSLADDPLIQLRHIGKADSKEYTNQINETLAFNPHYQWLGSLGHEETLEHIRQAHVLVHTSKAEGGAHVILEAVQCGTPVLASRIDGNVGMLGSQYSGYFPVGDADCLAQMIRALRNSLWSTSTTDLNLTQLRDQCKSRSALFDPALEKQSLLELCAKALGRSA